MAPSLRPGPVANESSASEPLHNLLTELLTAQKAWEDLGVRLALGYNAAYGIHVKTLAKMKKLKTATSTDSLQFVFSIVSIGFAGGFVGGLMGPWVKNAAANAAQTVLREVLRGIAQQGAKDMTKTLNEKLKVASGSDDPYTTNSPDVIAVDLDIRDRIGSTFGPMRENVLLMIAEANKLQSSKDSGQDVLNNFRRNCPLLLNQPAPGNIPKAEDATNAAELAMWVAWANERDWPWWGKVYSSLDSSPRVKGLTYPYSDDHYKGFLEEGPIFSAFEIDPVGNRLMMLGKWGAVFSTTLGLTMTDPAGGRTYRYTDLRKLSRLPLDGPFKRLDKLNFKWDNMRQRATYLSSLKDVKPIYK